MIPNNQLTASNKHSLKFPQLINNGETYFRMIGEKIDDNYDSFVGGSFTYVYESTERNGVKCRFEVGSNMPFSRIEPPAINVHGVSLKVYKIDNENAQLILAANCTNLSNALPSLANKQHIADVLLVMGINEISNNPAELWDNLIQYMGLSYGLNYEELVLGPNHSEIIYTGGFQPRGY